MIYSQLFTKHHFWNKALLATRYCTNKANETIKIVPGLSNNNKVITKPITSVDTGARQTGEYKVPEYYCFDKFSFYEAEVELVKFRLPQPSANKPLN